MPQTSPGSSPSLMLIRSTLLGACFCWMLSGVGQAVTLTVIPSVLQAANGGAVPETGENINQDALWVVGGTSSGISYGTTQRPAIWTVENGAGGTGNFGAFLGTSDKTGSQDANPVTNTLEQGHNTSSNKQLQKEVNYGTSTDDIQLASAGIVRLTSTSFLSANSAEIVDANYITFAYDMNPIQATSNPYPHVTYTQFQVWISPTVITAQYPTGPADPSFNLGTKVWDLDANGTNNSITVHQSNNGSGSTDMRIYVPISDFLKANPNATADYYVYVWHEMETYGQTNKNDHGFVQATDASYLPPGGRLDSIPEPSATLMAALATLMAGFHRRRKQG